MFDARSLELLKSWNQHRYAAPVGAVGVGAKLRRQKTLLDPRLHP